MQMPSNGVEPLPGARSKTWVWRAEGTVLGLFVVESPAGRRWSIVDAAFLAQVLQQLAVSTGSPDCCSRIAGRAAQSCCICANQALAAIDVRQSRRLGLVAGVGLLPLERARSVAAHSETAPTPSSWYTECPGWGACSKPRDRHAVALALGRAQTR